MVCAGSKIRGERRKLVSRMQCSEFEQGIELVSTLTAVKQFEEIAIIALTGVSVIFCECMHLFLDLSTRSVYCF